MYNYKNRKLTKEYKNGVVEYYPFTGEFHWYVNGEERVVMDTQPYLIIHTKEEKGIYKNETVHSVIGKLFIEDWFEGCIVHHWDFNKRNNCIWNLVCMTQSEHSKEHYEGERAINLGKTLTEEHRKKISEAHTGMKATEEAVKNMRKAAEKRSKKVVQLEEGNFIALYVSIIETSRQTGINRRTIRRCCGDKTKVYKGYTFRYLEDYEREVN